MDEEYYIYMSGVSKLPSESNHMVKSRNVSLLFTSVYSYIAY
jgi:hypothetical protein